MIARRYESHRIASLLYCGLFCALMTGGATAEDGASPGVPAGPWKAASRERAAFESGSQTHHAMACPATGPGGVLHDERVAMERAFAGKKVHPTTARPAGSRSLPGTPGSRELPAELFLPAPIIESSAFAAERVPQPVRLCQAEDREAAADPGSASDEVPALPPAADKELSDVERAAVDLAHYTVYQHDPYPSATKCATCHPGHFREWSVSPHAYAQLSPVFNAMSGKINKLTNGTLGDFCIRCHTPAGMNMGEPMVMSNMDRHPAAREGVTCTVCHRINKSWGKGSARFSLVAADLNGPVYGTLGNEILSEVMADPDKYGVLTTDMQSGERRRVVHYLAVPFFRLHTSGFCGACHDVFAPNGFRLEDAFSEYKSSPAAQKKMQSCQDCHMGEVPGVAAGYRVESIAKVGNAHTRPRKRTNHMIPGPDHSIVHPGLFPHNPEAVKEEHPPYFGAKGGPAGLATMRQWLEFDYQAGWGTREFEQSPAAKQLNTDGPEAWREPLMRVRAQRIIRDQLELLAEYQEARRRILATGYQVGDIECEHGPGGGLHFRVLVYNGTDGHGVPTGFDAERVTYLRVVVWDANGKIVFVSGDLDPNGDVRDSHSAYVHNGELPIDRQLFSLQSRFITRNIRGGEREQVLAVTISLDPLPYIRPEPRPFTILGRPFDSRKHKQNLEANGGRRWARYHVQESQLTGCGPYTACVQLLAGMVPVNLVHEISDVGFGYGLSPEEIARRIVEGHVVLHSRQAVLE